MEYLRKNVVILGSTGSIGISTLSVIDHNLDRFKIFALTGNNNLDKMFEQCCKYSPEYAVILDKNKSVSLVNKLKLHNIATKVLNQESDIIDLVQHTEVDIVMSAIVGSKGLLPTYYAIKSNKRVLLANKESLVAAGEIMISVLNNSKGELIPVDSEHSAIFQCLYSNNYNIVSKIILTASGGPFLNSTINDLVDISVEEALKHPNWIMGKKVTIDSSTLMNKGLEFIEAYWLFGCNLDKLEVVIHPQSIIHSMVEYVDGSVLAQLGTPDMKTPIAYSLSHPDRIISDSSKLDFTTLNSLTFCKPDYTKFPCLKLAIDAIQIGKSMPAVLNAANEIAVNAFLQRKIGFYGINRVIEHAMNKFSAVHFNTVEEIVALDNEVRQYVANELIS